jgi:hypothetical protein
LIASRRLRRPTGACAHGRAAPTACEKVRAASDRRRNVASETIDAMGQDHSPRSPCLNRRNKWNFSASIVLCVRHPIC